MIPGLMDSHIHPIHGAIGDAGVDLSIADTMDNLLATLYEIKHLNPGDGPIDGRGWQNFLFGPQGPKKEMLG